VPVAAAALLGAVGVALLLALVRPGLLVVIVVVIVVLAPGRWWWWRKRHFRRGLKHLRAGEDRRARAALGRFLEEVDGDARFERWQPVFNLGRRYSYRAAAETNLGVSWLREGDPEAALARFRRALEIEPGWLQALHGRAAALHLLGDSEGAESAARAALEARPTYLPSRALLGLILRERGNEAAAAAVLAPLEADGRDAEEVLRRLTAQWGG